MRIPRIFTPDPLSSEKTVVLQGTEATHIARVLRMKPKDKIHLFDGREGQWLAEISAVVKQKVDVNLLEFFEDNRESFLRISLGQCLSRGERMDYAIQKATEMGVTNITPLFSERCEVKLNAERQEKRLRHWQQLAISACEQCGRNIVPVIHPPCSVHQWVRACDESLKLVLHHRTEKPLSGFEPPLSAALLIGPEGGLSLDEISQAEQEGFYAVALGPRVLRTETAPVAAIAVLQYLWGDWHKSK